MLVVVSGDFFGVKGDVGTLSLIHICLSHLVSGLEEAENQRLDNVLRTKPKRDENKRLVSHDALVTNLDLELPTTPTPKHIELTVSVGDTVFLTGPSGVGKSTFLKTIAGFKANYTGLLNRNIDQKLLWLPQKSYLMKGTLRDNPVSYTHLHIEDRLPLPVRRN